MRVYMLYMHRSALLLELALRCGKLCVLLFNYKNK